MLARVLYRDGLMLVIDKPAGQAVHPGPKGGPSLLDYFEALRFGLPRSPGLAHRLDRDTSGCLVLGRHRKALAHLGALFRHGRVRKAYWAVVEGGPEADEGRIDLPLGRLDVTRGWWMKPDPDGQPAVTTWRVLGRASPLPACGERSAPQAPGEGGCRETAAVESPPHPDPLPASGEREPPPGSPGSARGATLPLRARDALTWLLLEPLTGRTHQLRVHCAAMGWPVVGDAVYGTAPRTGGPPLHLHAREVVVPLYPKREPVHVVAPVPEHMRAALTACGWRGEEATAAYESSPALSKVAP
ncbi:MAG: RNA pseudouridine synthase [Hyphomicrobiales bacterium]|nr:RNA pseudouridine synthase [Hyphomicrobiales bacterium]MBV8826471.1 RNA pseudouridine synthase [Hyphomicrobiales bacterium]MBV9427535.1 RNA pseudouridine synthase [Bradyrhizobiaceae bacterium]